MPGRTSDLPRRPARESSRADPAGVAAGPDDDPAVPPPLSTAGAEGQSHLVPGGAPARKHRPEGTGRDGGRVTTAT